MPYLRPLPQSRLTIALARAEAAEPSYVGVGVTAVVEALTVGYRRAQRHDVIGSGRDAFERGGKALDTWALQNAVGFSVFPADKVVVKGESFLVSIRSFGLLFVAPVRIIYVVDEPNRHGFAYGTLPGHPESGEEYFGVSIDENDNVYFDITAFSKPGTLLTRLGAPIARRVQRVVTNRYSKAMAKLVSESES